ncbi:hypothetical protein D3C81_1652550 [compost metagenome]
MALQGLAVEAGGGVEQRVERRVDRLARLLSGTAVLVRHLEAGALGQLLDRLGKLQVVVVHDEAEGVAAGAAAEAVVELLVRADAERGGLFVVERAAGAVVLAGLLQLDARTHHLDDVGAVEQVVDEALRDQAGHGLLVCMLFSMAARCGKGQAGANAKNSAPCGARRSEKMTLKQTPGRSRVLGETQLSEG